MKALLNWIDDRTGLSGLIRNCLHARIPGRPCGCRVWPAAIGFALCVQVITGFFMWVYYSPSAQTAWESVYFLQYEVVGGWLLRAVHHWSGQVLLVLAGLYLLQMIFTGAYRAPRELIYWTVLLMVLVTLGLLLTGDLLAWDQNSYASTQVRVSFLDLLPVVGGGLYKLAAGGPQFGHLTLTRFLALHICCMTGGLFLLLLLHVALVRRSDSAKAAEAEKSVRYWPRQAFLDAAAVAIVLVVILLLSVRNGMSGDQRGVELGSPADTSSFYAAARPEWAFRGLYEFAHLFPGEMEILGLSLKILPIFVIPGLVVCIYLAMPWIARRRGGHLFNLVFTAVLLVGMAVLSLISVWNDRNNDEYQAAVRAEADHASRAVQLARAQGIPPTGALTLLRNDPKTQGPILFKAYCANCHDHVDVQGKGIKAEKTSAPNLYGFASRPWLAGLLDPKRIATADYFGNTAFRAGDMASFVEEVLSDLAEEEKQELKKIVIALSAEAALKSQRNQDAEETKSIGEGRELMVSPSGYGCGDCHRVRGKGRLGNPPDLTGYGSREWIIAVISNPADPRFYGERNDRMPAYAEFPDEPAKNTLRPREIGLLTDWFRRHWYNDAPHLDLDADDSSGQSGADFASTFTAGGAAVRVADSDAVLSDVDSANLCWLIVTINSLADGTAESLSADTSGSGVTADYDSATGALTLSGGDTVANYQKVLRTVSYNNTSQNPDTSEREISFVASDGTDDSNVGTTTVTVGARNEARQSD